jgi:glycosyltransferase involved in cell wall biosynthesis
MGINRHGITPPMKSLRILLATDAWRPQVNGVVRTWETSLVHLKERGHVAEVIEPQRFFHFPMPLYPEIELAVPWQQTISRIIRDFEPDTIHIATEGPIGQAVRMYCRRHRQFFTTSYHTQFPEYAHEMTRIPVSWGYRYMRWFHSRSSCILVATPTLEETLRRQRFEPPLHRWSRGVDLELFYPRPKKESEHPRPHLLYVGRVSKEKNLEAFLELSTPGTKFIAGDGPIRERLEKKYPEAVFLGYRRGQALAETYANADLFVFPSKTDTFGLVIIEALASGLPVAGYPVIGPIDIVTDPDCGALHEDLKQAIDLALQRGNPEKCVQLGRQYTWDRCTQQLLQGLVNRTTGRPFDGTSDTSGETL